MPITTAQLKTIVTGDESARAESLRTILNYPVLERDSQGSRFWYLRPGDNPEDASETCPIAVGFYQELNRGTDQEIKQFLTSEPQQQEIYGHYIGRIAEDQPVMYLLFPSSPFEGGLGGIKNQARVAFILPTEGGLRQRGIQTFAFEDEDLRARLARLHRDELADKILEKALNLIPQVDWIFYKPAETAQELAHELAAVTQRIERAIPDVYSQENQGGYLHKLLESFQKELLPNLKLISDNQKDYSFSDIYAQTIAYGLFTARVFSYVKNPKRDFNRYHTWQELPETNPFLRQLFKDVSQRPAAELGDELIDSIGEAFGILRAAKMEAILTDFRNKMNREDIVIRFYEDFLAAYKPQMREKRGVYYTPEPVVSYIVRSVDELIKDKFNKPLGIADPEVMILDPACGTGTFLLWVFQLIHKRFEENPKALTKGLADKSWSGYVSERLLPRIFGFELLMAPYAICHLKLGLFLEETGYQFESGKRLGVYLTNTLDDSVKKSETLLEEFIAEESNQAAEIKKDKPVMVILGNPPYSVSSENQGEWIRNLLQDYKKDLNEKKMNLDDDYIKFLRFAQWRIKETGHGILAFISNNGYLNGLTHRRMRESLTEDFDEIFILDLHGNSNKKECTPKGYSDENVFDIQQGVAIGIFTKSENNVAKKQIKHHDFWGLRSLKYERLIAENISKTKWSVLEDIAYKSCLGTFFFFAPKAFKNIEEYCKALSIKNIFVVYQNGIKTDRDELFFDFSKQLLEERIQVFYSDEGLSESFRKKYRVEKSSSYDLVSRRLSTFFNIANFYQCLYRPFDKRWLYYSTGLTSRPAWQVMQHMLTEDCVGLITTRQTCEDWDCLVTQNLCGHKSCAAYDINSLFPLYLQPNNSDGQQSVLKEQRRPNFSPDFLKTLETKLGYLPTPEAIFYYIYAIFHSPTYRSRYAEFLKIDFPRVPLTSNNNLFRQLADYGGQLVQLHLMTSPVLDNLITEFIEKSDKTVAAGHPKYNKGEVHINTQGDCFKGVPEAVWNFYIGGYQVCQKWLKDRKGRTLSDEDILHYHKIVVALAETIKLMQLIDAAIPGFPIK
ncbi:MAG: DNA methyltransferase [Microcystis aeruginosa Ma_MB_F_20061100_S20]|uniref:site-specific DNA-methyltransferase (adenine-specific) n=1 Tax=Microcystis aeruginosa Ma_MB_F_20061100_S20D TaxID=2486253 RepID=A0A552EP30_MICAE|nr:MAG: DNA methyltransferase [Microcystis aeruginosa Ma_MB_F_20061100_S20]TRU36236.1 MAG: DNA methyltransferase [Microcystis aeruginosa Ma_MB_F_20061100_S20D]